MKSEIIQTAGAAFSNASDITAFAMLIVGVLLVVACVVASVVAIVLAIKYIKYNHTKNSVGMTGRQIAEKVLSDNGLHDIKVTSTFSLIFGNSYSHYFKRVRLRHRTWKKDSVSSLAMAAQKSALAILDRSGDPDMKARVFMTPIISFGPLAFIPLIIIGIVLDMVIFETVGTATLVCCVLAALIYIVSFAMSVMVIKTEKKAQELAIDIMRRDGLANEVEIEMCRKLFRLYNIEYINNMLISLLEMIYRILQIMNLLSDAKRSATRA